MTDKNKMTVATYLAYRLEQLGLTKMFGVPIISVVLLARWNALLLLNEMVEQMKLILGLLLRLC